MQTKDIPALSLLLSLFNDTKPAELLWGRNYTMVLATGIEPATYTLQEYCSTN